ncbi:hypothetical protein DSUL_100061 [Desulfovibrionales bacterium]
MYRWPKTCGYCDDINLSPIALSILVPHFNGRDIDLTTPISNVNR